MYYLANFIPYKHLTKHFIKPNYSFLVIIAFLLSFSMQSQTYKWYENSTNTNHTPYESTSSSTFETDVTTPSTTGNEYYIDSLQGPKGPVLGTTTFNTAEDNADNYGGGWNSVDNNGTGFRT